MHLPSLLLAPLSLLSPTPSSLSTLARTAAIVDISNTIALFALLLDTHDYARLHLVFTPSAVADFNATGVPICRGLPAIQQRLADLADAPSQMALSTQYVNVSSPTAADATTYVVGTMFTPGWSEPSFVEYGRYHTKMVWTRDGWRVERLVARGWATFDKWVNSTAPAAHAPIHRGALLAQHAR